MNGAVLMRWVRLRALLLVNLGLFALFMVGVLLTGHAHENEDLSDHSQPTESLVAYAGSSSFGETVFENWESEFLQMGMYVLLTTFLVQKGSAESRPIGESAEQDEDPRAHRNDARAPWPVRHGSELVLRLYENSLAIAFGIVFFLSFWLHAVTGAGAYSQDQAAARRPGRDRLAVRAYVAVLVRVVPELAERVPRGRGDHRRLGLPAPAFVIAVEARPCAQRPDRRLTHPLAG